MRIFFHAERCMLCQSCVLACQMNSIGVSDVMEIPREEKPLQRMAFIFSHGTPWVWRCQQCLSAPCVEACVTGSLRHGEGGKGVVHDRETCVGCGSCVLACPFDALTPDENDDRVTKCNLCPEEEIPPCVKACQSGALVYEDPRIFAQNKRKKFLWDQKVHYETD